MRSYVTSNPTASNKAPSFAIQAKAKDPAVHFKMAAIFVLALLTMIAAGMMSMHPSNASQAEGLTSLATQGLATTKSDRVAVSKTSASCDAQAWGAWSEECAASLTGANKVRNVSFVTVEQKAPSVNETILARFPTTN
ncbi:phosphopantetheine adenylyltransferase [Roseibium sp. MMSF_3544]|uniref:phosphopantetheine adenylyltransferase n=1 Tax=unclassified Roseibium TaxID=2629323 RepID=UPI00273DB16E|nr:phosphopantetheine adenylyltransferase [Roseibium sp. MMSF_3544]